jgi:hypothetical protein
MKKVALANFKGLSQDVQRANFAKNLLVSLFNGGLSNDATLSPIHADGHYL